MASEPQMKNVAGSGTGRGGGDIGESPEDVLVAGSFRLGVLVGVVQKPPVVVSMTVEVEEEDEPFEVLVESVEATGFIQ